MNELRTVIGIRTHQWGSAEKELYDYLSNYFDKDNIYIIIDETTHQTKIPDSYNKISISLEFLKEQSLLDNTNNSRGLLWLCGDYFYYAFLNKITADYYWLIETDVRFTFDNAGGFFNQFSTNNADALLCNFLPANEDWYWSTHAKLIDLKPYKCFFPLSRLSKKAIIHCQLERRNLTKKCVSNNLIHLYPNDEALVATTMSKYQLNVDSMTEKFPEFFQFFTYTSMILNTDYLDKFPNNKILHPVRSLDSMKNRLFEECYLTLSQRTSLTNYVRHLGQYFNYKELASILNDSCLMYAKNIVGIPNHLLIVEKIYEILKKEYKIFDLLKNSKLWVWNENVVVLDVVLDSKKYTIEYIVDGNVVSCNVFSRNDNLSFLNFLMKEFNLGDHFSVNKIMFYKKEFNENLSQIHDDEYVFIHNTMNVFNDCLLKFKNLDS